MPLREASDERIAKDELLIPSDPLSCAEWYRKFGIEVQSTLFLDNHELRTVLAVEVSELRQAELAYLHAWDEIEKLNDELARSAQKLHDSRSDARGMRYAAAVFALLFVIITLVHLTGGPR